MNERDDRVGIYAVKDGVLRNLKNHFDNVRKYQIKMRLLKELIEMQIADNKNEQEDISRH